MLIEIYYIIAFVLLGYLFNFGVLLLPVSMMAASPLTSTLVKVIQRIMVIYIFFGPALIGLYVFIHGDHFGTLGADARMALKTIYWMGLGCAIALLFNHLANLDGNKKE